VRGRGADTSKTLYTSIDSPTGSVFVAVRNNAVTDVALGGSETGFVARLTREYPHSKVCRGGDGGLLKKTATLLGRYLAGEPVSLVLSVDARGTPFQKAVWRAIGEIPRAETRPYTWVAARIGRPGSARAVGNACGANPVPIIIPCHRVVRSDGSYGGYTGGAQIKTFLLALERQRA